MLEQMKMLGVISGLMKNREKLEAAAKRVKDRLETLRVTGLAGGGAVRATATGTLKIERVELAPSLAGGLGDAGATAMAEQLIKDAVNDAIEQAQARAREIVSAELKELGLGDLNLGSGGLLDSLGGMLK